MSKVIVVGGGASGMVSAIVAARNGSSVTILEKNNSLGKKILVTGNGKCNYFNDDFSINHYYSNNIDILDRIINDDNKKRVLDFFLSIGVIPDIKNGYYYPYSNQAISIVNALNIEIKRLGINVITNCYVNDIKYVNESYIVNDKYSCDKLIISSGSYSYYNYDDVNSYKLVSKLGFDIINPMPALVQLVINNKITKEWAGVRVYSKVKLYEDNKFVKEEEGEVLFTNYGVSGICIMQLSGIIARGLNDHKYSLVFNFIPNICDDDVVNFLDKYNSRCPNRKVIEIYDSLINYKLGNILVGNYGNKYYNELTLEEKNIIFNNLINYKINIDDTKGYKESQVCSGGVKLDSININSMESISNPGLYVIGELLDVNGDCGGYNLGFAWLSGIIAGDNCD
ncbi:MAG: aminoacetone oxidase family FAD-binding enzyme [Bacilli bacterium]|nr:aminoacetone oxidase family FAD-binding enzyme [Bacilli bacterium]